MATSTDNATVNLPLSARGDIDAQLDRHRAAQAQAAKARRRERRAQHVLDKAEARAMLERYGAELVARMVATGKGAEKATWEYLRDLATWEPAECLRLLRRFAAERSGQ